MIDIFLLHFQRFLHFCWLFVGLKKNLFLLCTWWKYGSTLKNHGTVDFFQLLSCSPPNLRTIMNVQKLHGTVGSPQVHGTVGFFQPRPVKSAN